MVAFGRILAQFILGFLSCSSLAMIFPFLLIVAIKISFFFPFDQVKYIYRCCLLGIYS